MIFNFPNILLCLILCAKFAHGCEEAVDFLASFSSQSKTNSRLPDVFEPTIQPETLEKNWLSLGTSKLNIEPNDKHYKKATDKNDHLLEVLRKNSNNIDKNELLGNPVKQNLQPNGHGRSIAASFAENSFIAQSSKPDNVRGNYMYDKELLVNHDLQYQSSVGSSKNSKIMAPNKRKTHITEIDAQKKTQNIKEQALNPDSSKLSLKRIKKIDDQTVANKKLKKTSIRKKRKYQKKHESLLLTNSGNSSRGDKVIITPQQKAKFEDYMMKLLEPENSWVKLDFIQGCISSIQIIVKHGGEEFYIRDSEVRAFFSTPEASRFKIKSDSNPKPNAQSIRYRFLADFKKIVEAMSFENIVKKILNVDDLNSSPAFKPELWQSFELKESMDSRRLSKKIYVGKVFLVYSIIINKIFCDGPNDDRFIERQRAAIEFYDSVFGSVDPDDSGNFVLRIDSLPELAESSSERKVEIENGISIFNTNLGEREYLYMNYERALHANAMFLLETWLSLHRTELYKKLNIGIFLRTRFKPFLNSIFEILLQISGQLPSI
ncbi:hypothetical protein PPACK8108_LOCUS22401 [Phakopsora pachyrhizi]|uniref:Uncharacterized protein n=1 Tax=Phakopsora pachyrhizi TaxID=170000 RepID=A0AAV0BK13_PHAPC|nr:hypothetical protein PPACK8108_LOCUS22401 [Phakopsora pachyrhizi]